MNNFTKYQHSVLDVVKMLIAFLSGRSNENSFDSSLHYTAWLSWRIEEGWDDQLENLKPIDDSIRELARLVAYQSSVRLIEILENKKK